MEKAIEIKRRAQRCVQNGDLDGALREYEKLVETPESDPYNFVLLADLLYKKGDQPKAAERYLNAVSSYEKAGLYKNAIAVCKKMMRLTLSQAQVLRHLAELHALDGLTSEASIYFAQFAEHMVRANNIREAVSALRKAFDNGQENVKLLEQLSEVLLLEGENTKAAAALREAAGHWKTRGQGTEANRCLARALQLDPAGGPAANTPGADPAEAMPSLTLPTAAVRVAAPTPPASLELDRPAGSPASAKFDVTKNLPIKPPVQPAPADLRLALEPRLVTRFGDAAPPPADSGMFEHSPRFVVPSSVPANSIATPPVPSPGEIFTPSDDEVAGEEAGVYEIGSDDATNYESALSAVQTTPPVAPVASTPPPTSQPTLGPPAAASPANYVPTPSALAQRPEGLLEGVALVEQLLARAQEEFRAGDRVKASQVLVDAALTYERLGRLDSAATIFRSLGRGSHTAVEVMKLWLENCEKRNDRAEGSQVACELGDRALNEGQEGEARTWFEHATAIDATNDTARRRLQRLNNPPAGLVPPVRAAGTPPPEVGRVEVALGRGQAVTFDLAGLLQEFQRGVESQLDGDAQGHYDLGMAYREMGLHDQAIEAFTIASREPRLAGRVHEMIGRCHADRGTHDEAVAEFIDALRRSSLDGPGEAEIRYQLGLSLAALGDHAAAIQQLETADMCYPGRSDVAARLVEWRRTFGKAA